jgi:hypothetical protein
MRYETDALTFGEPNESEEGDIRQGGSACSKGSSRAWMVR